MSKFFIRRTIFAIVISLAIVILGILSAIQLPVAQFPKISPPTVLVRTNFVGANANIIDETVAQIIEQQVNGTQGMDYMTSYSDDAGIYRLFVTFQLDTDADMDAVKVQNNVAVANSNLPVEVQNIGVTTRKSSNTTAVMIFLYSPKNLYDRAFMKNYADIYFLDKIKRVPGVGEISVWGSDYSMKILLNPEKLSQLNLTINDVISAIQKQNRQAPAGNIGAMPTDENQEKQFTIKIDGKLSTPEEFSEIVLRRGERGQLIRLKDVAKIETGMESENVLSKVNNFESVGFGIQLTSDANSIETVDEIKKIVEEIQNDLPPDLNCKIVIDNTEFIRESIREVIFTFFEALILVSVVTFIFLQNFRATIIPLLAVPVSLIGTFSIFILPDFSINTLTLFAMVLAIGLVVDDAIVVIENVERHIENKLSPIEETEKAMDEVQGALIAIAFVLSAVFIPAAFFGGMTGILYRQFALTISFSTIISVFVALSLTPALCVKILRPKEISQHKNFLEKFFDKFNFVFSNAKIFYFNKVLFLIGKLKFAGIFL